MKITKDLMQHIQQTKNGTFKDLRRPTITLVYRESCAVCGDPYFSPSQEVREGKGVHCSNMCSRHRPDHPADKSGEDHPNFGRKRPDMKVRMAGNFNPMWRAGSNHPMYGKRGEESPGYKERNVNWRCGVTPAHEKARRTAEYKEWRKAVFARDNYACRDCGSRGVYLHAHHKNSFTDYPEQITNIDNGITLCKICHRKEGVHDMLDKNDKKWIKEAIAESLREALTVKVRFEKRRDIQTGQPLAVPEIEVKDVYLPAHWVEFLPWHEAALRGSQETLDKLKNNDARYGKSIEALTGIILSMEHGIKAIAGIAENIKRLPGNKVIEIEHLSTDLAPETLRPGDH